MGNEDLVSALAAIIADEIGDRLHNDADELGEISNCRQTSEDTAEFWFEDGRHVVVTVAEAVAVPAEGQARQS